MHWRRTEVGGQSLTGVSADAARAHLLRGSSYFKQDLPRYLSFDPVLQAVSAVLDGGSYTRYQARPPEALDGVNYQLIDNKDGGLAWRPFELMHPALYVSLVNAVCEPGQWAALQRRFAEFTGGAVTCCSLPVMATDEQSDTAAQVRTWWQEFEQRSIALSLEYSHLLHTDVTNCYGTLYTQSIAWALHGRTQQRSDDRLLGHVIAQHIAAGRSGQTNGMPQGTLLTDLLAELVLGHVDTLIASRLGGIMDFHILRYRDDYRIFANDDTTARTVLQAISDALRTVHMSLGVAKTIVSDNVVEGAIKPDKRAGMVLQDLGTANARTIQKQLLRLHAFGRRYRNSGALRRLLSELHESVAAQLERPDDLPVQVAIATDIACESPLTFPAVAGILSYLIALAPASERAALWQAVRCKMARIPYNGYLQIWLQRITRAAAPDLPLDSTEPLCHIAEGRPAQLWNNAWTDSSALMDALDVRRIVVADAATAGSLIHPEEVKLFKKRALSY